MKKLIMLFLTTLSFQFSFGQDEGDPIVAMPTRQNKALIIDLMVVSKFDEYFTEYCSGRIEFLGKERALSQDKIDGYKKKINFPEFLDYTVFNQFARFTTNELNEMIALSKKLNSNKGYSGVFFSTKGLEANIEKKIAEYMED